MTAIKKKQSHSPHAVFDRVALLALLFILASAAPCIAGAYIFAGEANGESLVTHPNTYYGTGGVITVRVCIDPASTNTAAMEIPVQNNITTYNRLQPTSENLLRNAANNIPSGQLDFESVALHELGHCIGMAHVNAASESGMTGSNTDYTKATDGANNTYDINPGSDGVIGSSDDIRGDDGNLHWYRRSNNNPFTIDDPVDATTYTRDLADLQSLGHSFATNAGRGVGALLGVPNTEAVMQQGTYYDEAQRTLGHDDVATLLYAASGVNEIAGTSDDYTIQLEYGGISSTDCNIIVSFTTTSSLAFCRTGGVYIGPDHARITSANIEFGNSYSWYFNTETVNQPPVLQPIGNQSVAEDQTEVIPLSADAPDDDFLSFTGTSLPSFASLIDHDDGTATLTLSPLAGDAGTYPVTIEVIDNGLPSLSDSETFDITVNVLPLDSDGDGLNDAEESLLGTDPYDVDSDDDGLVDGADGLVNLAVLPGGIDVNGDGYVDGEQDLGTDPTLADTDGDQLTDGLETLYDADPLDPDSWPNLADGDLAPLGNSDGLVTGADYIIGVRLVLQEITATPLLLAHGDLYPVGAPDGVFDIADLTLLMQLVMNAF